MESTPQTKKEKFQSLLLREVKNGHRFDPDMADLLVTGGKADVNAVMNGRTLLVIAIEERGFAVPWLLSKKAKVNIPSSTAEPNPKDWRSPAEKAAYPIHVAVRMFGGVDAKSDDTLPFLKSSDILGLLLQAGADPDKKDSKDRNALFYLPQCLDASYNTEFREEYAGDRRKKTTGQADRKNAIIVSTFNRLIAAGANINRKDSDGNTPLHLFAERGDLALVRAAIAAGAKVSLKNKEGKKPADLIMSKLPTFREQLAKVDKTMSGHLEWKNQNDEYNSEWESCAQSQSGLRARISEGEEIMTSLGAFLKDTSTRTRKAKP